MITFWVDEPNAFTIENYLQHRGAVIKDYFEPRRYSWRESSIEVASGPHIFAALDQLGEAEREAVVGMYDQLAARQPGIRPLNDPRRCLLRPALLRTLAEAGLNEFRAYQVEEARQVDRFPVFVRESSGHSGSLTELLGSPAALRRALRALRLRGYRPVDLLIVEFCDTSRRDGLFRKYAAYRIGEAVVATHLMAGEHWMVKSETDARKVDIARENLAYVEHNPHEAWQRQVFSLAGIEYGRLDFGVLDGRPQAWEINLNPTNGRPPGARSRTQDPEVAELMTQARGLFHQRLAEAFVALDPGKSQGRLRLTVEPELLERIQRQQSRIRHRKLAWASLRNWYHRPRLGAPLRALANRFLSRS